jgi:hypothetical protein
VLYKVFAEVSREEFEAKYSSEDPMRPGCYRWRGTAFNLPKRKPTRRGRRLAAGLEVPTLA